MEKPIHLAYNGHFDKNGNTSHLKKCKKRMSEFQLCSAICTTISISLETLERKPQYEGRLITYFADHSKAQPEKSSKTTVRIEVHLDKI